MATSSSPTAPPTVPAPEFHAVTFSSKDVPITAVTVFCEDKAEVTRVVNFSTSSSGVGPHEVWFQPGRGALEFSLLELFGAEARSLGCSWSIRPSQKTPTVLYFILLCVWYDMVPGIISLASHFIVLYRTLSHFDFYTGNQILVIVLILLCCCCVPHQEGWNAMRDAELGSPLTQKRHNIVFGFPAPISTARKSLGVGRKIYVCFEK